MGVTGLWRLIEPAGKPVPVESLENKVLAVDISIWLHQVVKGYQDAKGAPIANAHLMGLFQRLCKLLYFKIKPVFVFDGAFPQLKKETIAKRQDNKIKYNSESERLKREIALLLGKKSAIGALLGTQISPKKNKNVPVHTDKDDIFKLPALPQQEEESDSDSDDEDSSASTVDLHSVDIESEEFKNMPVKEKYDLLIELKDTRKMNSWGKLHTLPKKSDNFSDFQMQRLLKRRKVQECLEETEKEMGDVGMSLNELESFLNEEGIDTKIENLPTKRIASNDTTLYILINNVQQALADAKKREEASSSKTKEAITSDTQEILDEDELHKAIKIKTFLECEGKLSEIDNEHQTNDIEELDEDLDRAIKMSLECVDDPNTSASKTNDSWTSYKSDTDCPNLGSDSEEGDGCAEPDFSTAKAYIMQYSDFTHKAIDNIVASKCKGNSKNKCPDVNEIIEELNQEKSVIVDKVDLSSGEDEEAQHIDNSELFNTNPILKTDSQVLSNRHINDENKESCTAIEKCVDTNDMDITQSSVVYVEKPNEIITLDTTSDEYLEVKHETSKSNLTPDNNSGDQSDTSDDDFEEVSESARPAVQVTLNMPDRIENDIFADIFADKAANSNVSDETSNENRQLITSDIEMASRSESESLNVETEPKEEEDAKRSRNFEQELHGHEKITQNINSKTGDIDDIETIPQRRNPTDTHVLHGQTESEEAKKSTNVISQENLHSMVAEIETEEQNLLQEKGKMDRIGRNITEQMTKEAQELLRIFGIPYIVAPMEAEAQCAFLESINLTDGTITDDSDIWLFGGKTVYKNFFNQKKHVLQFLSERIEKSFNLTREQLILLALLVGSDYTTGVQGVGPVTALEILASFPFNKRQLMKENSKQDQYKLIITGLQEFKTWVRAGRRTDNISLKKKLRNVTLGEDFPSVRVVQAYLEPNVERNEEKFTWGEPDITVLRDYAKAKFGWSQAKLDVIIEPVLKRMLERKTQKSVQDYFKRKIDFQSLEDQMSKRVKAAVEKMDSENENVDSIETQKATGETQVKPGKKRKNTTKKSDSMPSTSATETKSKKKRTTAAVKTSATQGGLEINIVKTDRYQEIIPQREKDMQNILQNKLKAIEIFRKTKIDRKRKPFKKRAILPKDKADLSESSDSN